MKVDSVEFSDGFHVNVKRVKIAPKFLDCITGKKKKKKKKATLTLSSWKQEIKLPSEKYPPYSRRKEDILITGDREFGAKKSVQKYPVKLTLIFPVISSPFTTPGPNPSVLSIIHKFIVCKKV